MDLLADALRLRELIEEYGRMKRLEGFTPQSRGRRLNGLIAEVFDCWNIRAEANERSRGEIDVHFSIAAGQRFILEAKWTQERADTGVVAKLQKRVRQRLATTVGIVASMSGFTGEAVEDVKDGERLEVLLLDEEHIEAMLSGFVPPQELMDRLLDHASFYGDFYVPLQDLLPTRGVPKHIRFPSTPSSVRQADQRLEARMVVRGLPFGQSGVFVPQAGRLWITTGDGLIDVDLEAKATSMAVGLPDLHRNAVTDAEGNPLVLRKAGAAMFDNGRIRALAGGLSGNTTFLVGASDWIFCNSRTNVYGEGGGALLVHHDGFLGSQRHLEVEYPAFGGSNAGFTDDGFIIIGNPGILMSGIDGIPYQPRVPFPGANPMGMMHDPEGHWIVAAGEVDLYEIHLSTQVAKPLVHLDWLRGSISELASDGEPYSGFLYSHPIDDQLGCILRLSTVSR